MVAFVRLALDLYCLDCFGGLRRSTLVFDGAAASFARQYEVEYQPMVETVDVILEPMDEDVIRCTLAWAPRFEGGRLLGGDRISAVFHLREMRAP
jgi:hypothetical protein